ncbi:MAG TPA: thiazole synthase, partial [Ottowia sp.]|nr:thiazole synthase [Ottowia sp.]
CTTAREAVQLAHMARELYGTSWVKLEVIGDDYTLQPDPQELVEAARQLARDGFTVFPYCTEDLVTAKRLLDAGCPLLMPWGAPIGSGQGLMNPFALRLLRERLPGVVLIIDAGLGAPSHAAQALEMGFDAVLLNSAVSQSPDPVRMAGAFRGAIEAGRAAHRAGVMARQDFAVATTPVTGNPFLIGNAP